MGASLQRIKLVPSDPDAEEQVIYMSTTMKILTAGMTIGLLLAVVAISADSEINQEMISEDYSEESVPEEIAEQMPAIVSKTNNDQGVLLNQASSRIDKCAVNLSDIKRICQDRGAKAMLAQLKSGDGDGEDDDSVEPITQYLGRFPYMSQVDIGCSARDLSSFTKAIIVVHGAKRDADNYF